MVLKTLVETLLQSRNEPHNLLYVQLLQTLKRDVAQDVMEAFTLSRPPVDLYPEEYRQSASFVDFLFRLCGAPTREKPAAPPPCADPENDRLKRQVERLQADLNALKEKHRERIHDVDRLHADLNALNEKYRERADDLQKLQERYDQCQDQTTELVHSYQSSLEQLCAVQDKKLESMTMQNLLIDSLNKPPVTPTGLFGPPDPLLSLPPSEPGPLALLPPHTLQQSIREGMDTCRPNDLPPPAVLPADFQHTLQQSIRDVMNTFRPNVSLADLNELKESVQATVKQCSQPMEDVKEFLESQLVRLVSTSSDLHLEAVSKQLDVLLKGHVDPLVQQIGLQLQEYLGRRMAEPQLQEVVDMFQLDEYFAGVHEALKAHDCRKKVTQALTLCQNMTKLRVEEVIRKMVQMCGTTPLTLLPVVEKMNQLEMSLLEKDQLLAKAAQPSSTLQAMFEARYPVMRTSPNWELELFSLVQEAESRYATLADQITNLRTALNRPHLDETSLEREVLALFGDHRQYSVALETELHKSQQHMDQFKASVMESMQHQHMLSLQQASAEVYEWFQNNFQHMLAQVISTQQVLDHTLQQVQGLNTCTIEDVTSPSIEYPPDPGVAEVRAELQAVIDDLTRQLDTCHENVKRCEKDQTELRRQTERRQEEAAREHERQRLTKRRKRSQSETDDTSEMGMIKSFFVALYARYFETMWGLYPDEPYPRIQEKLDLLNRLSEKYRPNDLLDTLKDYMETDLRTMLHDSNILQERRASLFNVQDEVSLLQMCMEETRLHFERLYTKGLLAKAVEPMAIVPYDPSTMQAVTTCYQPGQSCMEIERKD